MWRLLQGDSPDHIIIELIDSGRIKMTSQVTEHFSQTGVRTQRGTPRLTRASRSIRANSLNVRNFRFRSLKISAD